ncbi:hypothetical protein [Streptomyces sp. NPDC005828]|uniref:hypothetical protein n=1 Tax=Streptomyces sp. NPDC005828 TaxID=3157071 RepID=UPI0033F05851
MAYRNWCGECGFKTAWGTQSQSERQQIDHYRSHHPGIRPGGQVETNQKNPSGSSFGCLPLIGIAMLVLILAASCRR